MADLENTQGGNNTIEVEESTGITGFQQEIVDVVNDAIERGDIKAGGNSLHLYALAFYFNSGTGNVSSTGYYLTPADNLQNQEDLKQDLIANGFTGSGTSFKFFALIPTYLAGKMSLDKNGYAWVTSGIATDTELNIIRVQFAQLMYKVDTTKNIVYTQTGSSGHTELTLAVTKGIVKIY